MGRGRNPIIPRSIEPIGAPGIPKAGEPLRKMRQTVAEARAEVREEKWQALIDLITEDPTLGIIALGQRLGIPKSTIWDMLTEDSEFGAEARKLRELRWPMLHERLDDIIYGREKITDKAILTAIAIRINSFDPYKIRKADLEVSGKKGGEPLKLEFVSVNKREE